MILAIASEVKATFVFAIFLLLLFLAFIVFIVLLYNKNQIAYIKEKQLKEVEHQNLILQAEIEKHKSLQKERERISHDMHDEIGAGLSAIKLQSEILKQNIDNQNISKNEIDELIHISEEINHSMREILWSLNSSNDNISRVVSYCQNYMETYFAKTKIHFHHQTNIENPGTDITTEVRRNILLIIKEACHNIVKHSQASAVTFHVTQQQSNLDINIQDNGVGINADRSEGYGLTTMTARTESIGGTIDINSNSSGTKININITLPEY